MYAYGNIFFIVSIIHKKQVYLEITIAYNIQI
jgi:hypothetical protein